MNIAGMHLTDFHKKKTNQRCQIRAKTTAKSDRKPLNRGTQDSKVYCGAILLHYCPTIRADR